MDKIFIERITLICLSCIFLSSSAIAATGAGSTFTAPKTKCFIEIGNAHLSTSIFEKQGRLAVKVNATSRCNVPQTDVILTVKIFKEGFGSPHLLAQKSTQANSPKSRGLVVKNQFTFVFCKNATKSKYYGVASARATINGKRYLTPPVWSEKTLELKCGT